MVAIAPLRAVRYRAGTDLARHTSPPHDCITPAQRDALLAAQPCNIVQVVLGPEQPGDQDAAGPPSRHDRARAALQEWMGRGTLVRDARPAFYHYAITWGEPGTRRTMHALVARVALDPTYKEIRPHERTLRRYRKDRLRLREATGFDCEPIWLLYRDERGWVDEILASNAFEELVRFTDDEGHEHRLWRVDRPEAVEEVRAQFSDRTLVIADGHHRYETALEHHHDTGQPGHGSILACLVRDNDPGIAILATHRLIHSTGMDLAAAVAAARTHWDAEPVDVRGLEAPFKAPILVGRAKVGEGRLAAYALRLRPGHEVRGSGGRLDGLAVSQVHERLLHDAFGLDPATPERHLRFERDADVALAELAAGRCELVVLLPPEPVDAVLEVASQGHVMPQKATYFVPKLRSGLVLSPLDEPVPQPWGEVQGGGGAADGRLPRF